MAEAEDLIRLTAGIIVAHAEGNSVAASDLPALIQTVHAALAELGEEDAARVETEEPSPATGAVGRRKSLASPEKIVSMIDGKPYSTLKRHIARHGFTPEAYRKRFGLKLDYPMVAPAYSALRKAAAEAIAHRRKIVGAAAATAAAVVLAEVLKPAPKPRKAAKQPQAAEPLPASTQESMALVETARERPRRGRRPKLDAADVVPATAGEGAAPAPAEGPEL